MSCFEKSRKKCNDVPWLLLFISFWCLLIVVAFFSINYGNYLALINGYDSFGNICGLGHNTRYENFPLSGTDTSNKPRLITFAADIALPNVIRICAEHCPLTPFIDKPTDLARFIEDSNINMCRYDFNISKLREFSKFNYLNPLGPCSSRVQNCIPVGPFCVPIYRVMSRDVKNMFIQPVFVYIYLARYYIAGISCFALAVSILLLLIMRRIPHFFPLILCFLVITLNSGLCATLWYVRDHTLAIENEWSEVVRRGRKVTPRTFIEELDDFLLNREVVLIGIVVSFFITQTLIIAIICLREDFQRTIDILCETISCVLTLPGLIVNILTTTLAVIVFVLFWSYVMLCMTTANYTEVRQLLPTPSRDGSEIVLDVNYSSFRKIEFVEARTIRGLYWIYIIGFLWTVEFIFACERFFIGHSVAQWYFKRSTKSPAGVVIKYHLGSIAKGLLLGLPMNVLRWILLCLNAICLEPKTLKSLVKYLGTWGSSTYAAILLRNLDFYQSRKFAQDRFEARALQAAQTYAMFEFVLFLAKLVVTCSSCMFAIFLLKDDERFIIFMAPVLFSTTLSFLLSHIVFLIFEVVKDMLFFCVSEDGKLGCNGSDILGQISLPASVDKDQESTSNSSHVAVFTF